MDFLFSQEQEELREQVRNFLVEELPSDRLAVDEWSECSKEFSMKLSGKGWVGITWPKTYGGQGRSYLDRLVVTEELLRFAAPVGYHWFGDRQVGPSLIAFGTEKQKSVFLPKIISSDITFSILFSEIGAGSDLASICTTAQETGDGYIINGHKVWSSNAHIADYGWLLARTDAHAEKRHLGMSQFILDLKLPGITIRPLVDASGEHHFNQLFFDDVLVSHDALIGAKNGAWHQIMAQLDYERSGIERIMGNYQLLGGLVRHVRQMQGPGAAGRLPLVRDKLADLEVQLEVGRLLIYKVAWLLSEGELPNYESAVAKVFGTCFEQRLANVAMEVLGMPGLIKPGSKWAPLSGQAARSYLKSPSYTIQGGTTEVLRGIIAVRGLGMPAR